MSTATAKEVEIGYGAETNFGGGFGGTFSAPVAPVDKTTDLTTFDRWFSYTLTYAEPKRINQFDLNSQFVPEQTVGSYIQPGEFVLTLYTQTNAMWAEAVSYTYGSVPSSKYIDIDTGVEHICLLGCWIKSIEISSADDKDFTEQVITWGFVNQISSAATGSIGKNTGTASLPVDVSVSVFGSAALIPKAASMKIEFTNAEPWELSQSKLQYPVLTGRTVSSSITFYDKTQAASLLSNSRDPTIPLGDVSITWLTGFTTQCTNMYITEKPGDDRTRGLQEWSFSFEGGAGHVVS